MNAECQPCLKDWIQFEEKCYLFYNEDPPWMTAPASKTHCRNKAADLVVIDSLHEQVSSNSMQPKLIKFLFVFKCRHTMNIQT